MEEKTLNNWSELLQLVADKKREPWLYRGVTRCDYELIPKIGRKEARGKDGSNQRIPYRKKDERRLFEEFMRQARPMLELQPNTLLEWMAVAQHHGLNTRFLDWSESLLVAAMFATERGVTREINPQNGELIRLLPPAIYGIRGLPEANPNENPFHMHEVKIYRPAHISPRIAPQLAAFTVHPTPQEAFDSGHLIKWRLNIEETLQIKMALDAAGLSRASLFPGIDGITDALNWRYKWDAFRR